MSETGKTPGQAARDLQAERDHAEWLGWMEASAYSTHPDDCEGMHEAFIAGMQAARDLAAAQGARPAPGAAPELRIADCPAHGDVWHLQVNTRGNWLCAALVTDIVRAHEPQPAGPQDGTAPRPAAATGLAEERDRLALRLHAVRAILLDENAAAGDARSRAAAAAYDEVLPQPAPGLRADAETCRLLRADLADAEAQLARWPRCPDGCGCRLGTEDADARECACDGPCCMECREMGYPDAPSYRDIAALEPEPAPGLAAAMRESRGYRDALERAQRILADNGLAHSGRVRRAHSAVTAALAGNRPSE